ncbi:phage replisome organizer N-terminal domain-containing protein [Mammaliicoccus sciuri]|uniref:phage replisome organizer N-terminal domain-containing protein n=1 Tax=Mammaliicoccus sciuri TaxID=1296 RepID=UPI00194DEC25|nr:phage replisome organizer N-terminal domain-containing protein [Mammaliicoccus sciuri]
MAEVQWIKLKVGMFDDSKIKYIEALPERDTIITIWVKLLTLAGKYNEQGFIMLSENLPYNEEMLANEFNRPLNSVRLALQTFEKLGMVEQTQGVIKISNWEKHQNIEGLDKIREQNRLRKQRQRFKEVGLEMPKPEDERICAYCGENATTLDHIIPKSKGGSDSPENVVDCCKSCNSSKKDKYLSEFINDSHKFGKKLNLELIFSNSKLKKHVTRDVTGFVTQSHATEEELEEEKEREEEKESTIIPYKKIIEHLNNKTGKKFSHKSSANQKLIKARFNEDYTLEDFIRVIDIKTNEWINDEKMKKYLKPDTLFRTSNFDKYLNQEVTTKKDEVMFEELL